MTQLLKDPAAISNHFDNLFNGLGKGGSSFTDIDGLILIPGIRALIHNGRHFPRFFMLEFKNGTEKLSTSQNWTLRDFARMDGCSSLAIWLKGSDDYLVRFYPGEEEAQINGRALQKIIREWWDWPSAP